jgi:PPOX class probable F420-dependent enzyme
LSVTFEEWERQRLERALGVVSTISPDGGPHAAPVMVWFEGDDLRFETARDARKYKNLSANPRVAICVYGEPKWGVLVRGTAGVLPASGEQAQIVVHPTSKVSWRRKEAAP